MKRTEVEGGYELTADFGKELVGLVNNQEVARTKSVTVIGKTAIKWVEDYEKISEIVVPEFSI